MFESESEPVSQPSAKVGQPLPPWAPPVLLGLALLWLLYRLFTKNPFWFTHNLHLPIHEAGHMIFMPFGEFMHFLGGSAFQVLFPAVFTGSFFLRRDYFAAAITLLWIGDSLIDVSFYVGDAYRQEMPLLGGEHDWAVLLGMLDMTHHADLLGGLTWWAGALTMLTGFSLALFIANLQGGWLKIKA